MTLKEAETYYVIIIIVFSSFLSVAQDSNDDVLMVVQEDQVDSMVPTIVTPTSKNKNVTFAAT